MKFPKCNINADKTFTVDGFGGITDGSMKDGDLSWCENVTDKEKSVVNRPNLVTVLQGEICDSTNSYDEIVEFELTDAVRFQNGEYNRMAVATACDWVSSGSLYFYFISEGGKSQSAGSLTFNSTVGGDMGPPESVKIFNGNKMSGCGIFVMVCFYRSAGEADNTQYQLSIYELNEDMNGWLPIFDSDTHIADYYINGRGTMYGSASFELPEPEFRESVNMLNDMMRCYYTSDSVSSFFRLPVTDLSKTNGKDFVKATLHITEDDTIDLTVRGQEQVSSAVTFDDHSYTMNCNLSSGAFSFYRDGQLYVPPHFDGLFNDIIMTVRKTDYEDNNKIALMTKCITYNGGKGGSALCLAGNRLYPSLICVGSSDKKLYFPKNNQFYIGDKERSITAFSRQGKALVVFKQKDIYSLSYNSDGYSVQQISGNAGCDCPDTVCLCGNKTMWLNSDGRLYMLSGVGEYSNNICIMSDNFENVIKKVAVGNIKKAKAIFTGGRYLLLVNNKIVAISMENTESSASAIKDNLKCFVWTLPDEIKCSSINEVGNKTVLLSRDSTGKVIFCSVLADNGGKDTYICYGDGSVKVESKEVGTIIRTKAYDCSAFYKKKLIQKIFLNISAKDKLTVNYLNGSGDTVRTANININNGNGSRLSGGIKLLPLITANEFSLEITGQGEIGFSGFTAVYRLLV